MRGEPRSLRDRERGAQSLFRLSRPHAPRRTQDQDKTANSCCFNLSIILIGLRARWVQVAEAHLPDLREFENPSLRVGSNAAPHSALLQQGANYVERSSSQCPCSPV